MKIYQRWLWSKFEVFESLYSNIKERVLILKTKCSVNVSEMSDCDILQKYKDFTLIDREYSEILDRVTELAKASPPMHDTAVEMLARARNAQVNIKTLKISYENKVLHEIGKRDLTQKKIKNASILGIELPKFKGYDFPLDFYNFRSQFEKLIVPRVQAHLLTDYLKNNYLSGQALLTVKEIDNLDQIWERLKLSFGNVNTLLANKLKSIEGSDPLWKLKSDNKIIIGITKLKNLMIELNSLAEKHDIQTSLFHSSNLAKNFHVIGKKRQTDVMKKVLDTTGLTSDQEIWNYIVLYLDKELKGFMS